MYGLQNSPKLNPPSKNHAYAPVMKQLFQFFLHSKLHTITTVAIFIESIAVMTTAAVGAQCVSATLLTWVCHIRGTLIYI